MFIYFSLLSDSFGNFDLCHYIVICFIVYYSLQFAVSYQYFVIIFVNTVYNINRMSHMDEYNFCFNFHENVIYIHNNVCLAEIVV